MKSILDLCRLLPDSEPEIRERAEEFNRAVWLAVAKDMYTAMQGMPDYLNSTADAKAASDIFTARGNILEMLTTYYPQTLWLCQIRLRGFVDVEAWSSTEELARSAAALLASEAMKEKR